MSSNISIVIVGAQGDANIGAASRAMKNFGLTDLRLVSSIPHLTKAARMWAVDAKDVLEGAKIFENLDDALADATFAVAFTRRVGKMRKKEMDVFQAGTWIRKKAAKGQVALVFGREDKGLSNAEIRRCDATISIPTSERLPSLNLAQAILIACYELQRTGIKTPSITTATVKFAQKSEVAPLMKRVGTMLEALDYTDTPSAPLKSKILHQFEKLFGRAGLTIRDIRMFEGLIARIISR